MIPKHGSFFLMIRISVFEFWEFFFVELILKIQKCVLFEKEGNEASEQLISMVNMDAVKLPSEKQIKLSWKNIVVEAPDNLLNLKFLNKLTKKDEAGKRKKTIIDNGKFSFKIEHKFGRLN